MYSRNSAAQLADRVRSLIGGSDRTTIETAALEMMVAEGELRDIVIDETRYPSVGTLGALVAFYGVDAGWLLTGHYSPATHRAVEEEAVSLKTVVSRVLRDVSDLTP